MGQVIRALAISTAVFVALTIVLLLASDLYFWVTGYVAFVFLAMTSVALVIRAIAHVIRRLDRPGPGEPPGPPQAPRF
jgi:hypothetical protein